MSSSKVIITRQKSISNQFSLEDEVGLSTYDLALISLRKIIKKSKSSLKEPSENTYLI
tara:strand:+ start:400 stop:573 length:174 start_codon:yes stop_codon:yes gene_type:complete